MKIDIFADTLEQAQFLASGVIYRAPAGTEMQIWLENMEHSGTIRIRGPRASGKTTLIEKIAPKLKELGKIVLHTEAGESQPEGMKTAFTKALLQPNTVLIEEIIG